MKKKLSIIMPVYNEANFVEEAIEMVMKVDLGNISKELIVVNDGSRDGTKEILEKIAKNRVPQGSTLNIFHQKTNQGKGAAIRRGLKKITGDFVVVQDGDMEYDPSELPILLKPILDGDADVVFGSRFMGDRPHRVLFFWHMVGNWFLTLLSNMFTNINLTDMETGYKVFTAKVAKKLDLKENRFGMEPEFTAKVAQMKCRIFEVGISYHGRGYEQGKKIGWKDGVWALWCVVKYNLFS